MTVTSKRTPIHPQRSAGLRSSREGRGSGGSNLRDEEVKLVRYLVSGGHYELLQPCWKEIAAFKRREASFCPGNAFTAARAAAGALRSTKRAVMA